MKASTLVPVIALALLVAIGGGKKKRKRKSLGLGSRYTQERNKLAASYGLTPEAMDAYDATPAEVRALQMDPNALAELGAKYGGKKARRILGGIV